MKTESEKYDLMMKLFPMGVKRLYLETRKKLSNTEPDWDVLTEDEKKGLVLSTMNDEFQKVREELEDAFPFKNEYNNTKLIPSFNPPNRKKSNSTKPKRKTKKCKCKK